MSPVANAICRKSLTNLRAFASPYVRMRAVRIFATGPEKAKCGPTTNVYGHAIKYLLTKSDWACARSVRHDLEPNIFSSGSPVHKYIPPFEQSGPDRLMVAVKCTFYWLLTNTYLTCFRYCQEGTCCPRRVYQ